MHRSYIHQPEHARKAVLMIHGICSTPRHFDWLLPSFDDSWAVYNILLDGHGGSVQDFAHSSMEIWKKQTRELLDELCRRYETVLLVGYSMGTLLHLHALPGHPQVKGMLLLNTPMRPWVTGRMILRSRRMTKGKIRKENPHEAACRDDVSISLTPPMMQYLGWLPRFWELLGLCRYGRRHAMDINIPCYAYFGRKDELVSIRSAKYFRGNPHVTTRIFDSAGHFWFSPEDKETVLQDLNQLIKSM